jgi:uncharacterized coiled-coil protein SlyX
MQQSAGDDIGERQRQLLADIGEKNLLIASYNRRMMSLQLEVDRLTEQVNLLLQELREVINQSED